MEIWYFCIKQVESRTIYFGNVPESSTISKLLNYVNGMIDTIKHISEKNCVFVTFIDYLIAQRVFKDFQGNRIIIDDHEVKVGWGHSSALNPFIYANILKGATRNVFINNLDPIMNQQWLIKELSRFGTVETVRILAEKRIAFVHMMSIASAIKAVSMLQEESQWASSRIFYGRDRCGDYIDNADEFKDEQKESKEKGDLRTVYLGGIKAGVKLKTICDVLILLIKSIRGGILQHIRYLEDKNVAFATFIYPSDAAAFYQHCLDNGLAIKSKKVKIGWGNPSSLPLSLSYAVQQGANRNVYVGQLKDTVTEEILEKDFSMFGEIEMINFKPTKNYGFISFLDISCAIRAVATLREQGDYVDCKIGYGKDRCGLPFRSNGTLSPPSTPN
jgi:RNA recognition motif-containing protein